MGTGSLGVTQPATTWYLAEGSTGGGSESWILVQNPNATPEGATGYGPNFTTWVLVQNPTETPTDVNITYGTGAGEEAGPAFQMPANSRKSIRVNDQLPPGAVLRSSDQFLRKRVGVDGQEFANLTGDGLGRGIIPTLGRAPSSCLCPLLYPFHRTTKRRSYQRT